jgi:hypothetical protein
MKKRLLLLAVGALLAAGCAIPCGVNIHRPTLMQYGATPQDVSGIQFYLDVDTIFDYRSPTTSVQRKDVQGGRGTFEIAQERTEGTVVIRPCTPCTVIAVNDTLTEIRADFGEGIELDFEADRSGIYFLKTREFTYQGKIYTLRHWRRQNLRVDAAFMNRLRVNQERTVAPGKRVE